MFEDWNKGELDSFLIEITRDILRFRDDKGRFLLEQIRDTAGQKGTGKWTAIAALEYGVPVTLIGNIYLHAYRLHKHHFRALPCGMVDTPKKKIFCNLYFLLPTCLMPQNLSCGTLIYLPLVGNS